MGSSQLTHIAGFSTPTFNPGHLGPGANHMMPAFAALALLVATGLALPDAEVCSGQGGDSCDAESSDDPSLLSHQIRRVISDVRNCDGTSTNSGSMSTALKYADIDGYDLTQGGTEMESKEDWVKCSKVCSDTYGCHAWTFHWDQKRCYPKANAPFCSTYSGGPWKKNNETISGGHNVAPYMTGNGAAFNNAESGGLSMDKYPDGFTSRGIDWQKCQQFCKSTDGCTSWTFKYSTLFCYVKDKKINTEPWDYNPDVISGWR